ncbi:hypothetical protein [Eleftheria terrae]|uniref:hypothetical protein n=1 Tax=Eleftheria terrae TaxID=1597781 RepID=UPI00263BC736|nr:hypothetical protein [Eleftheria terrae]WKB56141.1 hypothetical protein N7L95_29305 [Eleftheria terrae]
MAEALRNSGASGRGSLDVAVSSRIVPCMTLDFGEQPLPIHIATEWMRQRFFSVWSDEGDEWLLRPEQRRPVGRQLVFGCRNSVREALQSAAADCGLRLRSLQPGVAWACRARHDTLSSITRGWRTAAQAHWVVQVESDRSVALLRHQAQSQAVLTLPRCTGPSASQALARLLSLQERRLGWPEPAPALVIEPDLLAPEHVDCDDRPLARLPLWSHSVALRPGSTVLPSAETQLAET